MRVRVDAAELRSDHTAASGVVPATPQKISSMVSTTQLNPKPSGILLFAYCTHTAFLSDPGCLRSNENLDMTVVRLRKYPKAFLHHILQRDAGRNHALRAFEFT